MKIARMFIVDFVVAVAAFMTGYTAFGFGGGVVAFFVALCYGLARYLEGGDIWQ